VAVPLPAPRRAPDPHPQPGLAVLAVQSFHASGTLRGQGGGVRGWFAPRGSGGPRGTCPGPPQAMGRGPWAAGMASSARQELREDGGPVPSAPRAGTGRGLTWMPGGPGGPGGPGIPVGPRMPSLPCKSHGRRVTGAARAVSGHPSATPQSRGQTWSPAPGRAVPPRSHVPAALTFSAAGPGGPAGPTFPGKPGGP